MSEQPIHPGHVLLRATVEINGHKVQATMSVGHQVWNAGTEYQEHVKAQVLHMLGKAIVKELAPEVTVEPSPPTLTESLHAALRPFDYPQEY
jgi:hypothetical protein